MKQAAIPSPEMHRDELIMCAGKDRFTSRGQAGAIAARMSSRRGTLISPYRCQFCGCFHIGGNGKKGG